MGNISKISISGFKGINQLSFSPVKINILIGKNNSCKTSVLEAINLFYNYTNLGLIQSANMLVNRTMDDAKIQICENNICNEIKLCSDASLVRTLFKEKLLDEIKTFDKTILNDKDVNEKIDETIEKYLAKTKEIKGVVVTDKDHKELLLDPGAYRTRNLMDLELAVSNILRKIDKIKKDPSFNIRARMIFRYPFGYKFRRSRQSNTFGVVYVNEYNDWPEPEEEWAVPFRKEIEKTITDLELLRNFDRLDGNLIIYKGHDNFEPIELNGGGFKTMYTILWKIAESKSKNLALLLDEPDRHMHAGYVKQLIQHFIHLSEKENIQIFLTTHNCDLLDEILKEDLSKEDKEFLDKNLIFIKMENGPLGNDSQLLTYSEAKEIQNEMLFDLRGV